jgi:hypothetical protein
MSYGYRSVVAGANARGDPIGHRLEIDEAQAEIVREIFARYVAGESCQRIAADLNARAVRGPRGGTWCVSALYGSPAKGAGVLNNELYVGRYVWNRSKWIKNPDTGKRERFIRPESEWRPGPRAARRYRARPECAARNAGRGATDRGKRRGVCRMRQRRREAVACRRRRVDGSGCGGAIREMESPLNQRRRIRLIDVKPGEPMTMIRLLPSDNRPSPYRCQPALRFGRTVILTPSSFYRRD